MLASQQLKLTHWKNFTQRSMRKLERAQRKSRKKENKKKTQYQDKRRTIVVGGKDKSGKPAVYKKDRRLTYDERKQNVQNKIKKQLGGKKWVIC